MLGRPTLERLNACIDFSKGILHVAGVDAAMKTNEAGQLLVDVMDFPPSTRPCPATQQNSKITSDCKSSPVTAPSRKTKITLKNKECRCLLAQWKHTDMQKQSSICVAELFSPPRFTSEAVKHGLQGRAYDIKQGWNLDDAKRNRSSIESWIP